MCLSTGALCADAIDIQPPKTSEVSETEHLFIGLLYDPEPASKGKVLWLLSYMGAVQQGALWSYTNSDQNKTYVIHLVEDMDGLKQALYTEGAHVIIHGHSNFGLGGVFATPTELRTQTITNILYIDDDRILNWSSPWISVNVPRLIGHQAYPKWWAVFKDGTSGIMPYEFNDPRGDPPYNYYITYQVPGDAAYYKVETVKNSALERFPTADAPAWYSPDGSLPDTENPDDVQYYMTNPDNSFQSIGRWLQSSSSNGQYGKDYCYAQAGSTGDKQARWFFTIPTAGRYSISAWWPSSAANAAKAPFTINHKLGSTTVAVSQRINGGRWNKLGEFDFNAGQYSVVLSNKTSSGYVVADAVRITYKANATTFDKIIDNTGCPKTHFRSKTILFRKGLEVEPEKLRYARMLYEGCNTASYYLDTFHQGIMFYTVSDSDGTGIYLYLTAYLGGKSDEEIWAIMQDAQPVYDYYDFSKLPTEQ
jgi:hypothetical protein